MTRHNGGEMPVKCEFSDRLLTIKETALLTGLSVGTLYHFVSKAKIPVVRISRRCVRFRQSDLCDWIDGLTNYPSVEENPQLLGSVAHRMKNRIRTGEKNA
jgi:excisionase family DNA binding protein